MSRVENLGSYNKARIMLQEKNGDLDALMNEIKEIGALETLPKQIRTGILIGAPIGAIGVVAINKVSGYVKKRKQAKIREAEVKEKLEDILESKESSSESAAEDEHAISKKGDR